MLCDKNVKKQSSYSYAVNMYICTLLCFVVVVCMRKNCCYCKICKIVEIFVFFKFYILRTRTIILYIINYYNSSTEKEYHFDER